MPRAPDDRVDKAKNLYLKNWKLVDIAKELGIPEGTVRRWKSTYQWEDERSDKKANVRKKKKGGQPGNKNAKGGPVGNRKAEKYGFFSKYLPDETREIFDEIKDADHLDLLWHQIQIAYAAIIRAQRIAYVKDQKDKTKEKMGEFSIVQQAWDKQNEFMKAQARAQSELRSMIKQYDEMLNRNWELATEEQRARIDHIRSKTVQMDQTEEDGVEIINDAPTG